MFGKGLLRRLNLLELMIALTNLFIVAGVIRHWNDAYLRH
jgi:hypothetical protein